MDRIALLKEYIASEPEEPFNYYGLAMEYLAKDDLDTAKTTLAETYRRFPDYLPTYYQLAAILAELEENDEAKQIYEQGIALASKLKDHKIENELKVAYQNFLFEID